MKKRIARKWIEALRSGQYKQGSGYLRTGVKDFCCLGVLCDLYQQETGEGKWEFSPVGGDYTFTGPNTATGMFLPKEVQAWSGVSELFGRVSDTEVLGDENDNGTSFYDISCIIEDNWKDL